MARGTARLLHPMGRGRGGACDLVGALRGFDRLQEVTALEGFESRRRQAAHAERQSLQRRARIRGLFEDHNGNAGESEFAGEEEPNGARAGDDDVMGGGMMDRHKRSLVDDVRPERSSSWTPHGRTMDARKSVHCSSVRCPRREAKDQSFRYRKDLGSPDQVCLFRRRLHSRMEVAVQSQPSMRQVSATTGLRRTSS
jgi:hypothetical protein